MKKTATLLLVTLVSVPGFAQTAKSIFADPSTGTTHVAGNGAASPSAPPTAMGQSADSPKPPPGKPVHHAVRYGQHPALNFWVELELPSGEVRHVTTAYSFHTGERIRLHVRSNVNGHLTIVSRQPGEAPEMLFPGESNLDNTVQQYTDQTFPSGNSWFRFDDRPGELTLTLLIESADPSSAAPAPVTAQQVVDQGEASSGARGLKLEEDHSVPGKPSTYAANVAYNPDSGNPGSLAVEVKLHHVR